MKRGHLSESFKRNLLEEQRGTCYYCNQVIGTIVLYKKKVVVLRAETDHIIPFVYCQHDHKDNFVISCHICNKIKHSKCFNTMADCLEYIQNKWFENSQGVIECQRESIKPRPAYNVKKCLRKRDTGKNSVALPVKKNTTQRKPDIQLVLIAKECLEQVEKEPEKKYSEKTIEAYNTFLSLMSQGYLSIFNAKEKPNGTS